MSQTLPPSSSLWPILFQIDEGLRDKCRSLSCRFCGGKLHSANFLRKPRGYADGFSEGHRLRFGLCCASSSCRRRTLPPSARFVGRRVYLGIIVVLLGAFRQGPSPTRVKTLTETFGVDRRTIERWCQWWRDDFQQSSLWRRLRGMILLADEPVPRRFVLTFDAESDPQKQSSMMSFLLDGSP